MKPTGYKLGVFSWFGYRLHIAQRAGLIKQAGFSVTSIWWGEEEKGNTGSLDDLPGIIRQADIAIDNIHVPFADCNDLWSQSRATRQNIIHQHLTWLDDCVRHQIPKMVMHVSQGPDPPRPNKSGVESVARILQAAEDKDIIIAVENTQWPDYLDLVLSEINSPHLGFCYDSSHDFLWSKHPTEILAKYAGRLVTTHLSDNDGVEDRHWPPGQGNISWAGFANAFPQESYAGPLMLEVLPKDASQTPQAFLKETYESLSSLANLLLDER